MLAKKLGSLPGSPMALEPTGESTLDVFECDEIFRPGDCGIFREGTGEAGGRAVAAADLLRP